MGCGSSSSAADVGPSNSFDVKSVKRSSNVAAVRSPSNEQLLEDQSTALRETYDEIDGPKATNGYHSHSSPRSTPPRGSAALGNTFDAPAASIEAGSLSIDDLQRSAFRLQLSSEALAALRKALPSSPSTPAAALPIALRSLQQLYEDYHSFHVRRIQILRFIPNSPPVLSLLDWMSCCMLHCKNSIERTLLGSDVLSVAIRAHSPFLHNSAQMLQQFSSFLREQFYPPQTASGLHQQALSLCRAVQLQMYHKRHWMKYLLLPFHVLQLQAVEASHSGLAESTASQSLKREWIQSMKPKVLALETQIESMNAQLIFISQWFPNLADAQNESGSAIIRHAQSTVQSHGRFMLQSFSDLILGIDKWFEGLAPPVNVTQSPVKTVTSISGGANTIPINPLLIVQLPDSTFTTIITSHFAPRILAVHHIGLPSISAGESSPCSSSNWRGLHPHCLASFLRNMVLDIVCQLVHTLNIPSSASSRAGLTPNYPSIVLGLLDAIGYNRDTNPVAKSIFEQMNELELWHMLVVGPLQQIKPFVDSPSALRYAIAIAGIDEPSAIYSLAASILHPTSALGLHATQATAASTGVNPSAANRDASPARGAGYSNFRVDKDRYTRAQRDAQSNAPRNPFLLFLSKVLHTLPPWIGVMLLSTSGSKSIAATQQQYSHLSPTPPPQALSPPPSILSPSTSAIGSPNARPRSREVKDNSEVSLAAALRRFQPQVLDFSSVSIFHETELFELVRSRLQYYISSPQVNVAVVETIVSHAKECREGWRNAELVCEFLGSELCLQTDRQAREQILSHDTVSAIPHQTLSELYGFILRSIHERLALLDQTAFPSTIEVLQLFKLVTCALEPISIETITQVYNQHVSAAAGIGADPVQPLQIFEVIMRLTPLLAVQFPDWQFKPFPDVATFDSIDFTNTRVTVRNVSIQNWLLTLHQTPVISSIAGGAVVSPKPRRTKTQIGGKSKPTHHSEFSMPQVLTMDGSAFQMSDFACDAAAVHAQWAKICFERLQTTRSDKKMAKQDEFEELYAGAGRIEGESDTPLLQVEALYENGPTRPAQIPKDQLLLYALEFGPSHAILALGSAVSAPYSSIQANKGDSASEENELSSLCALVESTASFLTNLQYLHMRFAIGAAFEADSWKIHHRVKPVSHAHQALLVEYAQLLAITSNLLKRAQPAATTVPAAQPSPTSGSEEPPVNEGSIDLNSVDPHQQLYYYTHALEAMRDFVANNAQSFACDPWLVYSYALSYPDAVQSTTTPTLNDTIATAMNPAMSPTASSASTTSLSSSLSSTLAHFVWHQVQSLARVGWLESYFWPLATRSGAGGALDHFRGAQLMRNARQVDSEASLDGLFGEGGCWNAWLRWRNKPSILPSLVSSFSLMPLLVHRPSAPRVNAVAISNNGNFAAFAGDSSRDGLTNIVLINTQTNKPHNVLIGETGNPSAAPQPTSPSPTFGGKPTHRITSLCFTSDSRFLLSLHVSPEFTGLKMWEALGGKLVTSLIVSGRHSSTTASGSSLASKGRRGMERIEPVTTVPNPSVMVLAPDGNVMAISGLGCPLLLATLQPRQFSHGRSTSPAPNALNSTALVAPVLRVQQSLQNFSKEILAVAFSPSNYDLVANDGNEILRLWDTRNGKLMRSIVLQQGGIPAAESLVVDATLFSGDGMFIFVAIHSPNASAPQSERSLRVYNYDSGLWVHSIQFPSIVASVAWSRQPKREAGQMVFSSSGNEYFLTLCSNAPHQTVQLWSFRSKPVFEILCLATVNVAFTCVGQNARITCFDYCEDRKRLMVSGEEGVVRVYHLDAGAHVASLPVSAPSQTSSSAVPVVYTFAEGSNAAVAVPRKPYAAAARRQIAGSGAVVSNSNYNSNAASNFSSPPRQLTVSTSTSTGFGSPPQRKGGAASKYAAMSNVPSPKSPLSPADARVYIDATQSNANVPSQVAPTSSYSSLPTHRQTTLAFAPNSKQLLASSWDGCVRVYDIAASSTSASSSSVSKSMHTEIPELVLRVECSSGLYGAAWIAPAVQKSAAAAAASSTGGNKSSNSSGSQMQILSCSYNDEFVASVWNASDGTLIRNISLPRGEAAQEGAADELQMFTAMAVSPNSRWLVARKEPSHTADDSSTAHSEEISVFELYSNRSSNFLGYRRKVLTSLGHTSAGGASIGDITSLTFSLDSNLVASCSTDGTLRVVELESGTSIRKFYASSSSQSSHSSSVNTPHFICARFSPDNRSILAGVSTGSICMYSLESGQLLFELSEAHACEVVAVDFQRDGLYFLSAGARDGCVKLWRQGDQTLISILQLHHPQLDSSGNGKASKCIVPTAPSSEIAAAVFSPDGNWIAVSGAQKFISLFSLQGGSVSLGSGHGSSNVGGGGGFLATQPRPPERLMLVQPTRMHQAAVVVTAMLAKGGGITSPKAPPPQIHRRGRLQ